MTVKTVNVIVEDHEDFVTEIEISEEKIQNKLQRFSNITREEAIVYLAESGAMMQYPHKLGGKLVTFKISK
tara:strand:- start:45 stop:257 length:213 start_codon:yes stop_codon:yes gene_type:complete